MTGPYVSSILVDLEAIFLEKLNPVHFQWFIGGEAYRSNLVTLSGLQPIMITRYDWVSTVSIALIVLTYILITILVVILVRRGGMGKNHTSIFTGGTESQNRSADEESSENYTSHTNPISSITSRASPSTKQWKEVRQQVESSELPTNVQERYLNAIAHFDKRRFEEVRNMAKRTLTESDKRYMICFIVGMSITDIATVFHVEPTSLYTMKYRIKKKFPPELIDYIEFL